MIPSSDILGGDMIAFVSESIRLVNIYFMQAHKLENMFYCVVNTSADMLILQSCILVPVVRNIDTCGNIVTFQWCVV